MDKPSFSDEIANLLYASHGNPLKTCIQCGTCSGTCPVVDYMDHTPRRIIGMILPILKTPCSPVTPSGTALRAITVL